MTGSPPSAQDSNEPLCFFTDSLELDQCLSIITMPKNVQPNSVPKLVVARNVSLHWNPACFGFFAERDDDAFDDER